MDEGTAKNIRALFQLERILHIGLFSLFVDGSVALLLGIGRCTVTSGYLIPNSLNEFSTWLYISFRILIGNFGSSSV